MRVFAKTDIGLVRSSNQDSFSYGTVGEDAAWGLVCDGMGGANGGGVASGIAVKTIREQIESGYRSGMSLVSMRALLETALFAANARIYEEAQNDPNLNGMGTTAVLIMLDHQIAYIAHVGDSRAYHISRKGITQLTQDHSLVQEMLDTGRLTPDKAKDHPRKHMITRALGAAANVSYDYAEVPLQKGDVFLLCSDGLVNHVEDRIIYKETKAGVEDVCDRLIRLANKQGGNDNITVLAISE